VKNVKEVVNDFKGKKAQAPAAPKKEEPVKTEEPAADQTPAEETQQPEQTEEAVDQKPADEAAADKAPE
jgi:ribosomal protein L12E/L44/L45/RPP1/RPP2